MEVAGGISFGSQSARTETEPSEIAFKQFPEVIPLFQGSIFVALTFARSVPICGSGASLERGAPGISDEESARVCGLLASPISWLMLVGCVYGSWGLPCCYHGMPSSCMGMTHCRFGACRVKWP